MPDIFTPTGHGTFTSAADPRVAHTAFAEWQAHLDAGRLTPKLPTAPEIRANHERTHRILGLRFPK